MKPPRRPTSCMLHFLLLLLLLLPALTTSFWAVAFPTRPAHAPPCRRLFLLAAAAPGLSAAQRLQHAVAPQDILTSVLEELPHLKASHLSAAMLRLGKGLMQPKDARQRQQLIHENAGFGTFLEKTLGLVCQPNAHLGHVHDVLLGLALLEHPVQGDIRTQIESQLYHGLLTHRFAELSPGDVSALAWCHHKLKLKSERLPANMARTVADLPFRVLIGALAGEENRDLLDLNMLRQEVDLHRDTIWLTPQQTIEESRLTAWQGPKPFYYSGKEMAAQPMTPRITRIRDIIHALTGVFYDCVLVNLYEDGKAGMRYHIDPDQGLYWSTNTVVVSIGDTREFSLREISDKGEEDKPKKRRSHHRFFVSQSDATEMTGDCQWRFQHAIKVCSNAADAGPRMSLVFKQSLELSTDAERAWVEARLRQQEEEEEKEKKKEERRR